jgi:tripartite-type tricarboxylate transporter receptor subunit TctC
MRTLIRIVAAGALSLAVGIAATPARAQSEYPNRPIRMIIPLAAASAVDVAARIVTQKMSTNMGQQIVIINQDGAAGVIGAGQVAHAAPDGYTIGGFNDSIMTMVPQMHAKMPWNIMKDFEPVSLVATIEFCMVAGNATPYKTAADLIAAAKAAPGSINYASGGIGSPQHFAMALFDSQAGISLTHVPYRGATQAAMDVAGNQVPVAFMGVASVASLVRDHQMKMLGVSSAQRLAQFPDAPTISESGLPGFQFSAWFTIMAPAGTPKDIIARLNAEAKKALSDPDVQRRLTEQGVTSVGSSPEELRNLTRAQFAKYATLAKEAGIKAE